MAPKDDFGFSRRDFLKTVGAGGLAVGVAGHAESEAQEASAVGEATAYWCARTQKSFGPDGDIVGRGPCQHGRGCCD
jgi:hypothetical protein